MNWQDLLTELVVFVEQAAPAVWAIARRQVIAEIVSNVLWFIFLIVGGNVGIVLVKKCHRKILDADRFEDTFSWDTGRFFLSILSALLFLSAMVVIDSLVKRIINPDYYAIQLLISLMQ